MDISFAEPLTISHETRASFQFFGFKKRFKKENSLATKVHVQMIICHTEKVDKV